MFSKNTLHITLTVLALALLLSSAPTQRFALASHDGATTTNPLQEGETEPITLYDTGDLGVGTLLGFGAPTPPGWTWLFLGLTDHHPETTEVRPRLATGWSVDAESNTWTFTIRDDVPWMHWDPETGEATEMRKVVAGDFVTNFHRACARGTYGGIFAGYTSFLAGCATVANTPPEDLAPEHFAQIQAFAPDDTTLTITLNDPAGYIPSIGLFLFALPGEVIEEHGEAWTQPGNLWTNGPFMLDEWVTSASAIWVRNPLFPEELRGPGNVERVVRIDIMGADDDAYVRFLDNQIDHVPIPPDLLSTVLSDPELAGEVYQSGSDPGVFYFGFNTGRPPFDDVRVRRAFSAAFDRERFIQQFFPNQALPMMHFTPPTMFGAVPIDEVGIDHGPSPGFDPDFARAELAAAGYPDCEGFPVIEFLSWGQPDWVVFLQAEIEINLGCAANIIDYEERDWGDFIQAIGPGPVEDHPNMYLLAWGPDYYDANNWLNDVLHCEFSDNEFRARCTEFDDLVTEARIEIDPARRIELYRQAEEAMFGYDGEHRMMTLMLRISHTQFKPWVSGPLGFTTPFRYPDWFSIDQEAQQAARGG